MPASNPAPEAPDSCLRKGVSLNFKILILMRKIQDPHHFVKDLAEVPAQVPAKTLQVLTRDPSNPCLSDPNKDILDPFRGTSGP